MHVDLFYNKKHKKAFVILGHCKDFDHIIHQVQLFEIHTKIKLPKNDVVFKVIDKYKYENMVMVVFPMSSQLLFNDPQWIDQTAENKHLLKPREYKIET